MAYQRPSVRLERTANMSRLGIYADKIEAIREQQGLTPSGFKTDGTDPAKGDKEAMEREMYRRADERLPRGLTPSDSETAGAQDEE